MIAQLNCCRILFVCLSFIFPTLLFSQKKTLHLKQGRLFTTEGIEIKFVNLNQQGSVYTIQSRKGTFEVYDQNEVLRIDKKNGTEALILGGYIGTLTLLESWMLVRLTNNRYYIPPNERRKQNRTIITGSTVLGTLIGLLIGASKSKYKRVYDDPAFTFSSKNIRLGFNAPNNISSFTLNYSF